MSYYGIIGMSYNANNDFFSDLKSLTKYLSLQFPDRKKINICFIPTASKDSLVQRIFFRLYLWWNFPKFNVTTLLTSQMSNQNNKHEIEKMLFMQDIIYVGGGSTPYLVETWKKHHFDRLLQSVFQKRRMILSGVSAGLECWFKLGLTDNGVKNGPLSNTDGLGWIKGYCTPHYQDKNRKNIFDSTMNDLKLGYACEDGTALFFKYNQEKGSFKYDSAIRTRDNAEAYKMTFKNNTFEKTKLTNKIKHVANF